MKRIKSHLFSGFSESFRSNLNIGFLKKRLPLYYIIVIKSLWQRKVNNPSQKSVKKTLLAEIENKLAETLKGYYKKISDKKFEKEIRKAGKILSKHLTKEQITIVHKEKAKGSQKRKESSRKRSGVLRFPPFKKNNSHYLF